MSKSTTKNTKTIGGGPEKINTTARVVIVLVFIIALLGVSFYMQDRSAALEARDKMALYLKNKYGKDFEVGYPKLSGGGLGVSGAWGADAHPTDNKKDRFRVVRSEDGSGSADQYTG